MKYKVDAWNNFCRVFEVPNDFPNEYCFGGGHDVTFKMVDWFYPVKGISIAGVSKEVWRKEVGPIEETEVAIEEVEKELFPFLKEKNYVRRGRKYLVLYNFGGCSIFASFLAEGE